MLQLTQKLSNGEIVVQEVPQPVLGDEMIIIRNCYSLISAGTEGISEIGRASCRERV